MKKNKLFIILSIITIVLIFGVASTCTLCGTPVTIGETDGTVETADEVTQEEEKPASQTEPTTTTQPSQSTEQPVEGNNPPVIVDVEFGDYSLDMYESEGYFNELPLDPDDPVSDIIFEIIATDEDGDVLTYNAYDSHSSSFPVNKIDNNNAELNWTTPGEVGPYTLTIEVSDVRGGADSRSIEMNFIELPEGVDLEEVSRQRLYVVPEETGIVATNVDWGASGPIYVGDDEFDRYLNGYISFDILILAGVEVVSATLTMGIGRESGDRSYLGNLRIGTLDYGTGPLNRTDGDIPAEMLVQFPNSITDINYSGDELANALQDRIDAESNRFQLKVYWSHPSTDEDGEQDALVYQRDGTYLIVQYSE
jgi:hypothetical protein